LLGTEFDILKFIITTVRLKLSGNLKENIKKEIIGYILNNNHVLKRKRFIKKIKKLLYEDKFQFKIPKIKKNDKKIIDFQITFITNEQSTNQIYIDFLVLVLNRFSSTNFLSLDLIGIPLVNNQFLTKLSLNEKLKNIVSKLRLKLAFTSFHSIGTFYEDLSAIGSFINLEELDILGNSLESFPDVFENLKKFSCFF